MEANVAILSTSESNQSELLQAFDAKRDLFAPQLSIQQVSGQGCISAAQNQYVVSLARQNAAQNVMVLRIADAGNSVFYAAPESDDTDDAKIILLSSDSWIVDIDGIVFQSGEQKEIQKKLKKRIARRLVPLISQYAETHSERTPYLIFVISNAGEYMLPYMNQNGHAVIAEIIESAFGGIVTDIKQTLIMMFDSSYQTEWIGILSLIYKTIESNLRASREKLIIENQKIDQRISHNREKLKMENDKLFSSGKLIDSLESEIRSLTAKSESLKRQIASTNTSYELNHFGIALHYLIQRHSSMLISGFESAMYPYDDSFKGEITEHYWTDKLSKVRLIISIPFIAVMLWMMSKRPDDFMDKLSTVLAFAIIVFGGFAALCHMANKNIKGIVFGGCALWYGLTLLGVISSVLSMGISIIPFILYIAAFFFSKWILTEMDKLSSAEKSKAIVRFYEKAVQKGSKKNG